MRREFRERKNRNKYNSNTPALITGVMLIVTIATFVITFVVYSNKLESEYELDSEYLAQYNNTNKNNLEDDIIDEETEAASSSIGKTVDESKNIENTKEETSNEKKEEDKKNQVNTITKVEYKKNNLKEKDPTFQAPIEGEILKEFAKDSLVYSETLKEWTTHLGVDIKAERATVVKAAAEGIVKYIKNDPRYGLTIIIEHSNGFETRYANLLTTEFVSEGEKVKLGQTIGTVGDSAIYEIVDESHLHFEVLKNSENLNPAQYINF